jgi:hypothetical protein
MKFNYQFTYSKKKEFILFFSEFFFFIFEIIRHFIPTRVFKESLKGLFISNFKLIILANGPSLENDLSRININSQIFAVNTLPTKSFFFKFKPKFLCWIDSMFWLDLASVDDKIQSLVSKTYIELNKVDWEIFLFIPKQAKKEIIKRIDNKNIKIFELPSLTFDFESSIYLRLLSKILLPPPRINVAITAIYIAILSGIKDIDLIGADMNRIHSFNVNQKSNESFMDYIHFSSIQNIKLDLKDKLKSRRPKSMFVRLIREASTFKWFAYVSMMANISGVNLKNKSTNSLVDSIER